MLIHTSATKTKATTLGIDKNPKGRWITEAQLYIRSDASEEYQRSKYRRKDHSKFLPRSEEARTHTQDIQQDLVCRTGGARYQRDGARSESVASRCAVVGSTASGRSSHPGRPPNPAEQKLPLPHLVDSLVQSYDYEEHYYFWTKRYIILRMPSLTRELYSTPFSNAILEHNTSYKLGINLSFGKQRINRSNSSAERRELYTTIL